MTTEYEIISTHVLEDCVEWLNGKPALQLHRVNNFFKPVSATLDKVFQGLKTHYLLSIETVGGTSSYYAKLHVAIQKNPNELELSENFAFESDHLKNVIQKSDELNAIKASGNYSDLLNFKAGINSKSALKQIEELTSLRAKADFEDFTIEFAGSSIELNKLPATANVIQCDEERVVETFVSIINQGRLRLEFRDLNSKYIIYYTLEMHAAIFECLRNNKTVSIRFHATSETSGDIRGNLISISKTAEQGALFT